jgi:hypothetical protein
MEVDVAGKEIQTGKKPIEQRLGQPYAPPQNADDVAFVSLVPSRPSPVSDPLEPVRPVAPVVDAAPASSLKALAVALSHAAANVSDVLATVASVEPVIARRQERVLLLFRQNPDVAQATLDELNELVVRLAAVRGAILLSRD